MLNNIKNIFNLSEKANQQSQNSGTQRFTGRTSAADDQSNESTESEQQSAEDVDLDQSTGKDDVDLNERTIKSQLDFLNGVPQRLISYENTKTTKAQEGQTETLGGQQQTASSKNLLQSQKYLTNDFQGFVRLVFKIAFQFDTIVLVLMLTSTILQAPPLNSAYLEPSIYLFFQLFGRTFIELLVDHRRKKSSQRYNFNLVKKFFKARVEQTNIGSKQKTTKREGTFAYDLWQHLRVGDLITLRRGQECPADVLIIDMVSIGSLKDSKRVVNTEMQPQNTFFNSQLDEILVFYATNRQFKLRSKKCFQGTYMRNRDEGQTRVHPVRVAQNLSGTLIWEWNKLDYFTAQFRFADNSGSFDIKQQNIIMRGSYLESSHKLVCIVLNVGNTCYNNVQRRPKSQFSFAHFRKSLFNFIWPSFPHEYMRFMHYSRLMGLAIFILFIALDFIKLSQPEIQQFESAFLSNAYDFSNLEFESRDFRDISKTLLRIYCVSIVVLPLFFNLVAESIIICQAFFCEWDVNLVPANVHFNNLKSMAKLPWIGHVVTSPSAIEGSQEYRVTFLRVGDLNFHSLDQIIHESSWANQQKTTVKARVISDDQSNDSASSDESQTNLDYLPHVSNQQTSNFENQQLQHILQQQGNPLQPEVLNFIRHLCLCHQAKILSEREFQRYGTKSRYYSFYPEEEAQLIFARQFNYMFHARKSNVITLQFNKTIERYEELAYVSLKLETGKSHVTVQILQPFNNNGNITVNMKGSVNAVSDCLRALDNNLKENLLQESDRFTQIGFTIIAFCQRELNRDESLHLKSLLEGLNQFNKSFREQLEKVCRTYLSQMNVVGVLGLQKVVNLRNALVAEDLVNNHVKLWLMSQFSWRRTMTNIWNLNLIADFQQIELSGKTDRESEESLRLAFIKVFESEIKSRTGKLNLVLKNQTADDKTQSEVNSQLNNVLQDTSGKVSKFERLLKICKKFVEISAKIKLKYHKGTAKNGGTDAINNRVKRALILNGETLNILLRDDNAMRLFITLCMYCDIIIGCAIPPELKGRLAHNIKRYQATGKDGNLSYVAGVIGTPEDRYLLDKSNTDIVMTLSNQYNPQLYQVESDIRMDSFYSLTYLLLKHGSQLIRRLTVAGRLSLKRCLLFMMLLVGSFVTRGWSALNPFSEFQLSIYMTLLFQVALLTTVTTHKVHAFNELHRVTGQYQCNSAFKVFSVSNCVTTAVELSFDLVVILLLCGIGNIYQSCVSGSKGFALQNQAHDLKVNIVVACHTLVNFIRFPIVDQQNLLCILVAAFILVLTFLFDDPDLIGFKTALLAPQYSLYCLLFVAIFGLKLTARLLIRRLLPSVANFDKYNMYVHERLAFEQFESLEQIQSIGLDNVKHSRSLIDPFELHHTRLLGYINKNLLGLSYRNEVSELIFEQMGSLRALINSILDENKLSDQYDEELGLGSEHQIIYNQQRRQIDFKTLQFKFQHQHQDYTKNQLLNYRTQRPLTTNMLVSTGIMGLLYAGFLLSRVVVHTAGTDSEFESSAIILHSVCLGLCLVALPVLRQSWPVKRQNAMVTLLVALNILTMTQIQISHRHESIQGSDAFMVGAVILFTLLSRTLYVRLSLFLSLLTTAWYIGLLIFSTVEKTNMQAQVDVFMKQNDVGDSFQKDVYYYSVFSGVPVFVVICFLYVYWDEINLKVQFATQDRRIKDYKRLRSCVQTLVPEIVRKLQNKKDHSGEVSRSLVLVSIKIASYQQIFCSSNSDEVVFNTVQKIYSSIDKLIQKHGLLRQQAHEDRIEIMGGLKLFEQGLSQKLLSAPAIQRACKLAFDVLTLGEQLSKVLKQTVSFQVAIHCPCHIATGVIGVLKPAICLVGNQLNKVEIIVNKASPGQICISRECYDALVNLNIYYNMKVLHRIKIENSQSFENIYMLLEKRKQLMKPKMNNVGATQQNFRLRSQQTKDDPDVNLDVESSHDSSALSLSVDSEEANSGQVIQESISNPELAGSTFVKQDYQQQFQSMKEFRDDQEIAQNPILNQTYKLVQRKGFFLHLRGGNVAGENKFTWQLQYEYLTATVVFSLLLVLLVTYTLFQFEISRVRPVRANMQFLWVLPVAAMLVFVSYQWSKPTEFKFKLSFWINFALFLTYVVFQAISIRSQCSELSNSQARSQIMIALMIIFCQKTQLFKFIVLWLSLTLLVWFLFRAHCNLDESWYSAAREYTGLLAIYFMLILHAKWREMRDRIDYNRHVMIAVENKRNQEVAQKLMPAQGLLAIKQDQNYFETLQNATILVVTVVGFQDFANSKDVEHKPQHAFNLLNQIYTQFDELVEQFGLFKLHSDVNTYTVMGDPSALTTASQQTQQEQAFQVTLFAAELAKILTDICQLTLASNTEIQNTQYLMRLGLQMGIHTGSVVCCTTGTKFQQFQIFGKTLLTSGHVKQSAPRDQICITNQTKDILQAQQASGAQTKTLEFTEHLSVIREGTRGSFQTFTVQVRGSVSSTSSEEQADQYSDSSIDAQSSGDKASDESGVSSQEDSGIKTPGRA